MKISYRPEVDGLRAIAVLSVIFYHFKIEFFGFSFLSGGFLGVDIFFVISGFLITSIILEEVTKTNNFSILDFYIRRSRRILPALYVVILFFIILGFIFLIPSYLINFYNSIFYILFFLSNLFFYRNSTAYGHELSEIIPLLHTWTLSVEEQFYIIFPIFFFLIYKYFKNKTLLILISVFLISLFISEYFLVNNKNFNFYSPITRAWEFITGAFVAYFYRNNKLIIDKKILDLVSAVGLSMIIFSIFFFKKEYSHPSTLTLIPVIGSSLILLASRRETIIFKLLSQKFLVYIGLISYSLYLWHYPILSFCKILKINFNFISIFCIALLIFGISAFSYHCIEKFYRNKKKNII